MEELVPVLEQEAARAQAAGQGGKIELTVDYSPFREGRYVLDS